MASPSPRAVDGTSASGPCPPAACPCGAERRSDSRGPDSGAPRSVAARRTAPAWPALPQPAAQWQWPPRGATLVWGRRAGAGWPSRAHGPVLTWPGHRRLPWGPRGQEGGAGVHSALCEHPGVETGSAGAAAVSGCRQGVRLGRCPRGAARPPVCTVSVLPQGDGRPARRPVPGRAPQSLGGGGARAHFLSVVSDLTVWLRGDAGETAAAPRDRLLGSVDGVLGGDEPPLRAPGGPAACPA